MATKKNATTPATKKAPAKAPKAAKPAPAKAKPAAKSSKASKPAQKKAAPVPPQYRTVTAHLIVSPCSEAIAFYGKAFGAKALYSMPGPGGLIMHSEIKVGDAIVMLSDEQPPMKPGDPQTRKTPKNLGGTTAALMLYVKDTDKWFERAVAAGCTGVMPPMDMFWGDRYSQVEDPYGHVWAIATHLRDMTPKQMQKAMAEAFAQQS